jgi:hypothetical protein
VDLKQEKRAPAPLERAIRDGLFCAGVATPILRKVGKVLTLANPLYAGGRSPTAVTSRTARSPSTSAKTTRTTPRSSRASGSR